MTPTQHKTVSDFERKRIAEFGIQKGRTLRAKDFPDNTCPASRHAFTIADHIGRKKRYDMLSSEPEHCAASIMAVIAALWELRTKQQRAKK